MTFQGKDGKQYVAVADGVGGRTGSLVSMGLDGRDGYADKGMVNAVGDLRRASPPYAGSGALRSRNRHCGGGGKNRDNSLNTMRPAYTHGQT